MSPQSSSHLPFSLLNHSMRILRSFSFLPKQNHLSISFSLFSTQTKLSPQLSSTIRETPLPHLNNLTDPLHYLQSFTPIVETLFKNPRNFQALRTLDSLLSKTQFLDSSTSVIVVDYLSQIKKLERAKAIILHLKVKGKVSDLFLFSLVADCLVKNGRIEEVEIVWADICGHTLWDKKKIGLSDYVIYLCRFGGVVETKGICERVLTGSGVLEKQSYVALVGAFCRLNEGLLAKRVVKKMYDKGFKVDDLSLYAMFQCFCRNGEIDEADFVLRKLVKRGFCVDICVYGNFMFALCKTGKFREADKLFRKLVKRDCLGGNKKAEFLKEGRRVIFQLNCEGSVPEIMASETYFRCLCNSGRLDEAEVLLKKIMKSRTVPELCVYGSFIRALFSAARDEDAIKFLNVERKKGLVRVDGIARYVIVGLCEMGKLDEALRIFNEIASLGGFANCSNVCNSILVSLWTGGRVAEAEGFFAMMKDGNYVSPDVSTYRIMVNGYCVRGNVSEALSVFEEMMNSKVVADATLYEIIIRALCACGKLNEALKYLNNMIESGNLVSGIQWKRFFNTTFTALEHGMSGVL